MRYQATFTLDQFEQAEPYYQEGGLACGQAEIKKTFKGEIEGHSQVRMLSTRNEQGAGYVALEVIEAQIGERKGSFALLHAGTMSGAEKWASWPVVPGSGQDGFQGMSGQGTIEIDADGTHHFYLEVEFSS